MLHWPIFVTILNRMHLYVKIKYIRALESQELGGKNG